MTAKKKKLIIAGSVIGVLILAVVIKLVFFSDKGSYFNDVSSIVTSDLGSFEYVFDIRTKEYKEEKIEATDYDQSELEGLKNVDTDDKKEDTEGKHQSSIKEEWGNKDNISTEYWKYPNYKLIVKGQTLGVEPHKAYYEISLVTEYFNDVLTEIYILDDEYYINVEQLRYWLTQSQDAYLVDLGKSLVEGSNWLILDKDDFSYLSRYSELDENRTINSLYSMKENTTTMANMLLRSLESCVNKDSLSVQDNMKYFTLKNPESVVKKFKSLATNSGDLYDSYISNVYKGDDLDRAKKEKDNFIVALSDLAILFNTKDIILDMQGMTRTYNDNEGNKVIEATLNTALTDGETDYRVNISMLRSSKVTEIKEPMGSTVDFKSYNCDIESVTNHIIDYLNFTNIKTEVRLDKSVDLIKKDIDDAFIELINNTGLVFVTNYNFKTILSEYEKYDNKDKVLEGIIKDYYSLILQQDEEEYDNKEEKTKIEWGTGCKVSKNKELSNDKLLVYDVTGDLDYSLFSIKDGDNVYPCNNSVILESYDKNFDIPDKSLCFIIPSTVYEFELFYDDECLGKLTR